ncbi:hypothetical protein [Tenacibaculum jejuense]|uniref:Uncharacterized protein n=1 Tax=Tenacibaculum jejuense TaxID=584609 RepID=A0A238UCS3_9FLAO|nr:hypothetical protein [Tenacibaculum jejuense]SNR17017.1 conserved protein of unknown function [Tenacibaculum jejuense]
MGFNIAGIVAKDSFKTIQSIELFFDCSLKYTEDVDFDQASSAFKEEKTIDLLTTEHGTLIFVELGQMYDLSSSKGEIIQFIISEVSDTYYFEKFNDGILERKHISSQGEIVENIGSGIINEDEYLPDLIWEFADEYLKNNFSKNLFDLSFKRYQML